MILSDQKMYDQPKLLRVAVKLWNFAAASFMLGDGVRNKFKLLYLFFRWKVVLKFPGAAKGLRPVETLAIVFEQQRLNLVFPDDPSFPHIVYEVFVCRDYDIPMARAPECILDVGANMGMSCLFFSCLFPGARIFAFEPNAKNFRYLEQNTRHLKNVVRLPVGLFSSSGKQRLYLNPYCGMHSMVRPNDESFEEIETITLDEFLASRNIAHVDLFKIDVEGAEEAILTSTQALPKIDYLVGELHTDVIDQQKVVDALAKEFAVATQKMSPVLAVVTASNKRLAPGHPRS